MTFPMQAQSLINWERVFGDQSLRPGPMLMTYQAKVIFGLLYAFNILVDLTLTSIDNSEPTKIGLDASHP